MERRLSAILAVDVVGYSRLMERDEADTFERLRPHRKDLFEPEIAAHHGRVFKLTGDGLLAEFGSVVDAVECAVLLQRQMAERNNGLADGQRIDVRIGINLGDVIVEDEDRHGEGVVIAARLQQLAEPGGIAVSGTVADHVKHKLAVRFERMGDERLKNIAEPVTVYRASLDMSPKPKSSRGRARLFWAVAAAGVVAIAVGVAGALYGVPGINTPPTTALDQGIPKIVVLPFLEFTDGTVSLPNIGKGVAEAFNSDLSTFPDFAVVSTATSFALDGKSIPEIVEATGATFVVEGSIRVAGENTGITMQLIGASADIPRKVVQFNIRTSDAVTLQNQAAHRLRDELGGMTGFLRKEAEKIAWSHEGSEITEYDYYIRGHTFSMKEPNDWPHTYEQWAEGLARYPDSALMRYKLMIYYLYSQSDAKTASKLFEEAKTLKKKSRLDEWYQLWLAARLDSTLGNHPKAVSEAKAAIAMAPYDTLSHNNLAWVLFNAGLYDEALEWFQFAATDPNPKRWYFDNLVDGTAAAQKWPEAVDFAMEQIEKNPPALKYWYDFLGVAYGRTGQADKARDAWDKAKSLPMPPEF